MEPNLETKLIKRLKQSENHIEKLLGSCIERISELEEEADENRKNYNEVLGFINTITDGLSALSNQANDIASEVEKVGELALKTNELVRLNKELQEKKKND